jgi:hypothetical protein
MKRAAGLQCGVRQLTCGIPLIAAYFRGILRENQRIFAVGRQDSTVVLGLRDQAGGCLLLLHAVVEQANQ